MLPKDHLECTVADWMFGNFPKEITSSSICFNFSLAFGIFVEVSFVIFTTVPGALVNTPKVVSGAYIHLAFLDARHRSDSIFFSDAEHGKQVSSKLTRLG